MNRSLCLVAVLMMVPSALAQAALIRFPATGTDPHYPFELMQSAAPQGTLYSNG